MAAWGIGGGKWVGVVVLLLGLLSGVVHAESVALPDVVRKTLAVYFGEAYFADGVQNQTTYQTLIRKLPVAAADRKPAGVFVTLSHHGKPRACWGSVYPQHRNVVESTVYATLGALTKEYRYKPITRAEWKTLKPQVTVVQGLEPIDTIRAINPFQDGLLVRAGGKSGVMLPGEAKDAFYQLVQCKLKAGIGPKESFQMYRIVADVYQ